MPSFNSSSDSRQSARKSGTRVVSTDVHSGTDRAIGPAWSKLGASGKQPSSGTRPWLGLKPTTPHHAAGIRTEPPESVPRAASASPAASAAAEPPLEPPARRPGATGFGTVPKCGFCDEIPYANSCRFVLPTVAYPRRFEPGDRLRGALGDVLGEHDRAVRCDEPRRVEQVLDSQRDPVRGPLRAGEEDRHPMIIGRRPSAGSVPGTARSRQARPRALPPISAAPARINLVPADGVPQQSAEASKRKRRRSNSAVRVGQAATVRSDAQRTAPGKESGSHPTPIEPSGHHWFGTVASVTPSAPQAARETLRSFRRESQRPGLPASVAERGSSSSRIAPGGSCS